MSNTFIPAKDVGRVLLSDWKRIVNDGRQHPLTDGEAVAAFGLAFNKIDITDADASELLADKPREEKRYG